MEQTEPKNIKQNIWIIGAVVAVVLLGGGYLLTKGASAPSVSETATSSPRTGGTQVTSQPTNTPTQSSSSSAVKEFTMTAKKFDFTPSTITVSEGDKVKLTIIAQDVPHGFAIDELGIKQDITVGTPTTIEFIASKMGTFRFYCSLFCGSGHREMQGQLVVE
jgi:cytochrome c oxidase subunit 2